MIPLINDPAECLNGVKKTIDPFIRKLSEKRFIVRTESKGRISGKHVGRKDFSRAFRALTTPFYL